MHAPLETYSNVTLKYVKGTRTLGIMFRRTGAPLRSFSDSYFASDVDIRRSTSGEIHFFNNAPIHWFSQRQHSVVRSTCEAEYIAAA